MRWNRMRWGGVGWDKMGWDGMGWNRMGWDGMGREETRWEGIGWCWTACNWPAVCASLAICVQEADAEVDTTILLSRYYYMTQK